MRCTVSSSTKLYPNTIRRAGNFVCAAIGISLDCAFGGYWTAEENKLTLSCVVGVRVFAEHFFGVSAGSLRADRTWRKNAHLEAECSMEKVMQFIAERERREAGLSSNARVLVLLACDDYQSISKHTGIEQAVMVTQALAAWMVACEYSPDLHSFPHLQGKTVSCWPLDSALQQCLSKVSLLSRAKILHDF